jgi:hypothetical protein
MADPSWHPVDDYLSWANRYNDDGDDIERRLTVLEQLSDYLQSASNDPLPLVVGDEVGDALTMYLYAHGRRIKSASAIPQHLMPMADKARKHVASGGEYSIDHALGLSIPKFIGARPKAPGEHSRQRLFLIAYYENEILENAKSQIGALRYAADICGVAAYEEKSIDNEYRDWRNENQEWLTWVFDTL